MLVDTIHELIYSIYNVNIMKLTTGGVKMIKEQLVNAILDRLPMAFFGIAFINAMLAGEVCPKLNIMLTNTYKSIRLSSL